METHDQLQVGATLTNEGEGDVAHAHARGEVVRESTPFGDIISPPESPTPLITRDSNISKQDCSENLPHPVAPAV